MRQGAASTPAPWQAGAPAALVEWSEAHAYAALIEGAPAPLRQRLGLAVVPVAGACGLVAPGIAGTLVLNRVIGLGVAQAADDAALDSVAGCYADAAVGAHAVELSPAASPAGLAERLAARGYLPFKKTTMMMRSCTPLDEAAAVGVNVRRARADEATTWAEFACSIFRFDADMQSLLRAGFAAADWQHWLAFVEGRPAGAAATHLVGDVAWIGWVCTGAEFRGRGVQRAMTAAQLQGAAAAGARRVTLEAVTGSPSKPGPSLRNYRRMGFQDVHDRLTYLHRAAP